MADPDWDDPFLPSIEQLIAEFEGIDIEMVAEESEIVELYEANVHATHFVTIKFGIRREADDMLMSFTEFTTAV